MILTRLSFVKEIKDQKTLIGYFPCLSETREVITDDTPLDYISQFEEEQGNVIAVGWQQLGKEITPVFFIKNAKEISKHLSEWLNGDTSWFTLVWDIKQTGHYSIALVPDLNRILRSAGISTIDGMNVFQWVWCFNSVPPNFKVKDYLKKIGKQKLIFADVDTKKTEKAFLFPIFQSCLITDTSLKSFANSYLFK